MTCVKVKVIQFACAFVAVVFFRFRFGRGRGRAGRAGSALNDGSRLLFLCRRLDCLPMGHGDGHIESSPGFSEDVHFVFVEALEDFLPVTFELLEFFFQLVELDHDVSLLHFNFSDFTIQSYDLDVFSFGFGGKSGSLLAEITLAG